ncbi:MAG: DUF86 domain-containing protein [Oscillospiraceae bacterium]|nr:DUF86 domain-containing protein [Oscillospiraceae bacterium]
MVGNTDVDTFLGDERLKRACAMTIINIGELVKNISDDVRIKYTQIPWKAMAGFRDVTAHAYQTLRMEDVYNTITTDLPVVKDDLTEILSEDTGKTDQ